VIKILLVGFGGFLGSIARYWVQGVTYRWTGAGFPYGTFVVNIIGCFFIGVVIVLSEERFLIDPEIRIFLAIGLLGGFTTFSSFSYETLALMSGAGYLAAFGNIAANVVIGLAATWTGMALAKLF
jgi:CrcB protein